MQGESAQSRGGNPAKPKEERPMSNRQEQSGSGQSARIVSGAVLEEFLITSAPVSMGLPWPQSMSAFPPMALEAVADQLNSPDIEVVEKMTPQGILAVPGAGVPVLPTIVVARMTQEKAHALSSASGGRLLVARNEPLTLADAPVLVGQPIFRDPAVAHPAKVALSLTIEVQSNGKRLSDAQVYLFGSRSTVDGVTGADGRVQLSLRHETEDTIRGVAVIPAADAWSRYIERPGLDPKGVNTIEVRPLSSTFADFPKSSLLGWGQRAMRLDRIAPGYRGRGIRIAIIDSGADTDHRNLKHIKHGFNYAGDDAERWTDDVVGHGSHCAGMIAANEDNGSGVRGFAPEAEIHVLRVVPEGRVDDLVKALQYCMQNDIDVINLSIGAIGSTDSADALAAIVEPFLAKARAMGIAIIVAAGNTAGPLRYPARSPSVLAVSGIGKWGEFPDDSYHATLPVPPVQPDGFFFPRFGSSGPQVGLAAPGVAIVSCVPDNSFAAWDGSSAAAPHVVGLAALVLAHNPDFHAVFAARNASRVDHLFDVLRGSAQRLALGDPSRTGAGLPDAVTALQSRIAGQPGISLPLDAQAEIARRIAEAIQNALSPAMSWSADSMGGRPAPGPSNLGYAAFWPYYSP
jgi:subtilisin family serine protease